MWNMWNSCCEVKQKTLTGANSLLFKWLNLAFHLDKRNNGYIVEEIIYYLASLEVIIIYSQAEIPVLSTKDKKKRQNYMKINKTEIVIPKPRVRISLIFLSHVIVCPIGAEGFGNGPAAGRPPQHPQLIWRLEEKTREKPQRSPEIKLKDSQQKTQQAAKICTLLFHHYLFLDGFGLWVSLPVGPICSQRMTMEGRPAGNNPELLIIRNLRMIRAASWWSLENNGWWAQASTHQFFTLCLEGDDDNYHHNRNRNNYGN